MHQADGLPTQEVIDALPLTISHIRSEQKAWNCLHMFYSEVRVKMQKENLALKAIQDEKDDMFIRIQKKHDEKYGPEDTLSDYIRW